MSYPRTSARPTGAFKNQHKREVRPAARLSDIERLLDTDLLPRIIAFSGHEFCGHLLFEPDVPLPNDRPGTRRVPSADRYATARARAGVPSHYSH